MKIKKTSPLPTKGEGICDNRLCEKISVNSKTVIKMLLSERLYSAAQIFLQYTMDTVICQGSLDISLLEWSAAEWNQADIQRLSRSCRDT